LGWPFIYGKNFNAASAELILRYSNEPSRWIFQINALNRSGYGRIGPIGTIDATPIVDNLRMAWSAGEDYAKSERDIRDSCVQRDHRLAPFLPTGAVPIST
jgi:hypothetical protein